MAADDVIEADYSCERGVEIPVTYINSSTPKLAVLNVEGKQVTLPMAPSGSGSRYAAPDDQTGYIWWTKGNEATLSWHHADTEEAVTLLSDCATAE